MAHDHFGCQDIDFLDLFLPIKISSASRARAFLWLAFHYYEAPSVNPFDDQRARKHVGHIPELVPLSEEEFEKENTDPEDETDYATKMTKLRFDFLAKNAQQGGEANNSNNNKDRKGIAKSKVGAQSRGKSISTKRERSDPDSAVEDESDQLGTGTFSLFIRPRIMPIYPSGPPLRKRRSNLPKRLDPSRALSESSTSRTSNRHSSAPHRSILQRMTVCSIISSI